MVDTEAAISRAVLRNRCFEHAEQLLVAFVADGMHGDVQPGRIRLSDVVAQAFSVPVEELMGLSKPLKGSKKFAWHAARVKRLKPYQQRFVFKVVDLLLSSGDEPLPPMMFPVHSEETSAADLTSAADDEDTASAA